MSAGAETRVSGRCFGGSVSVHAGGASADAAAVAAFEQLRRIDRRLSRFRPESDLTALNRDPREAVPASPLLLDLAQEIRWAGERTGGLVDGTLLGPLEAAGYVNSMAKWASPLPTARTAPAPRAESAASPISEPGWATIYVDRAAGTVRRAPGVRLDSGGIGKGLAADRVAADLADRPTFCVDCCGDMRIGGTAGHPRTVRIEHPLAGSDPAWELEVAAGAVATSGVTRRVWLDREGRPQHHLIDPRTGAPARTGVLQATALAPTATEAEALAKAALLAGPVAAWDWLPHGGVLVLENGAVEALDSRASVAVAA